MKVSESAALKGLGAPDHTMMNYLSIKRTVYQANQVECKFDYRRDENKSCNKKRQVVMKCEM